MATTYSMEQTTLAGGSEVVIGEPEYPVGGDKSTVTIYLENFTGTSQDIMTLFRLQSRVHHTDDFRNHLSTDGSDDFASNAAASPDVVKRVSTYDASGGDISKSVGALAPGENAIIQMTIEGYSDVRFLAETSSASTIGISAVIGKA